MSPLCACATTASRKRQTEARKEAGVQGGLPDEPPAPLLASVAPAAMLVNIGHHSLRKALYLNLPLLHAGMLLSVARIKPPAGAGIDLPPHYRASIGTAHSTEF